MVRRADTLTGGHGARPVGIVAGFALKTARRTASMTQEQLAEMLRVDVSTIQGWESGRRPLAAAAAGDVMGVCRLLARAAAPVTIAGHIHQAIAADLILTCGVRISGELAELDQHPLASTVLRRTAANLVALPLISSWPRGIAHVVNAQGKPVASPPQLPLGDRLRFFDHLMVITERAADTGEWLLRRQAIYFLGFDSRPSTMDWIRTLHRRTTPKSIEMSDDLHGHLTSRSAAVALATGGDSDRIQEFVDNLSGERAQLVNLNFWAHWIGETSGEHADDSFMLKDSRSDWSGSRLLAHLVDRLDERAAHRPLNLRSLHTLVSYKSELLRNLPKDSVQKLGDTLDVLESSPLLTRAERDQVVGLLYAVRLADS